MPPAEERGVSQLLHKRFRGVDQYPSLRESERDTGKNREWDWRHFSTCRANQDGNGKRRHLGDECRDQQHYQPCFQPGDFAAGRRLADCAARLWSALMELSPESVRRRFEFPMQHVANATEAILFQLARGENWDDVTSYESWLRELAKVNFPDHMRIISTGS